MIRYCYLTKTKLLRMKKHLLLVIACICMTATLLWSQNRTITGKVTDEKGAPIPHATIIVKSHKPLFGASSQLDGTFSISIPPTAKSLVVSSVNFQSVELNIGDK